MSITPDSTSRVLSDTGPWTMLPEWVLDADITPAAVRLYAVLGRYSDEKGVCWPSRRALAIRLHVSVDTVDRALKELLALDAVAVEPRYSDDGQTSNRYFVYRSMPDMRRGGRVDEEGGSRADAEGGGRVDAAQNESHAEREPVEPDPLLDGAQKSDSLILRLAKVCTGPRVQVWPEATKVVDLLRKYFSDRVIDEGIGVCELLATPPTFPRYLLSVAQERSQETGQYIPDLIEEFRGDAA